MNKIYLIYGEHGDYSDHIQWNIGFLLHKNQAVEFVEKLKQLHTFNMESKKRLYAEFEIPYRKNNPLPQAPWRAEAKYRHNLLKYQEAYNEWEVLQNKWKDQFEAAQKQWEEENYHPPEELKSVVRYVGGDPDTDYDWTEVEVIE